MENRQKCAIKRAFTASFNRHRRRFRQTGRRFLFRGGDRRRFTVQHPVQRGSVDSPSATDAAGKARGAAAPSRRGLHRHTGERRGFPRGKIGSFNHRQTPRVAAMAEGFYRRSLVLSSCENPRPCAFLPSEVPRQEKPTALVNGSARFSPWQGIGGPFRSEPIERAGRPSRFSFSVAIVA